VLEHRKAKPAYPHAPRGNCCGCGKPGADVRNDRWHLQCWERYQTGANHRAAAERVEGKYQRCVDCGRVDGERVWVDGKAVTVKVERDHVIPLSLYGPKDWHVPRCRAGTGCHDRKSTRDNARTKEWRGKDPTRRAPGRSDRRSMPTTSNRNRPQRSRRSPLAAAPPSVVAVLTRWLFGAAFIAVAVLMFTVPADRWIATVRSLADDAVRIAVVAAVLALAGFIGILWRRRRAQHREDAVYRLTDALAREMQVDPTQLRPRRLRWSSHVPVRGETVYPGSFAENDLDLRARVEARLEGKLGVRLRVEWDTVRNVLRWRPRPVEPERDPGAEVARVEPDPDQMDPGKLAEIRRRVEERIRAKIKGDVRVEWGDTDKHGPKSLRVHYPSSYDDDGDESRYALLDAVNHKAPGRWAATWETEENRVTFDRRPPMPKKIRVPVETVGDGPAWTIPLGVDEHGKEVVWDMRVAPHALVAGATLSGKTVLLRSIIADASARGFVIYLLDPKRIEFASFRGYPGVRAVATSTETMIVGTQMLADEMDTRYTRIEKGEVTEDQLPPVLLVIDEATEFNIRVNAWWKAHKGSGKGNEHPVIERWRSMARLGRSGRIHLLIGVQRPDAKVIGGEARDNYGLRIAVGPMSSDGARMMFSGTDVGRDIPAEAKGRATLQIGQGGKAVEIQCYFTADARVATGDDLAHLEALRARAAKVEHKALPHLDEKLLNAMAAAMMEQYIGDDDFMPAAVRPAIAPPKPQRKATRGWKWTALDDLAEGDTVRIDVDGKLTTVVLTGPPCEVPNRDDVVDLEWRTTNGLNGVTGVPADEEVERRGR
jgi:DNA translocase FtsK/SpoIIIE-like protein